MRDFNEYLERVAELMDYVAGCIDLPMYAASCRPLWNAVVYASVACGMIVIAWVFWVSISRRQAVGEAADLQITGRSANHSRKRAVHDEGVDLADVTDPQLALKIRQELERQRIRNITGR